MKKTIFTFSSIVIVCGAIFLACSKDDNSATHVGYASQNGTGNNPDPNHTSTTSGLTTSGATTGSTTSSNVSTVSGFTVNGSAAQSAHAGGISLGSPEYQVTITDSNLGTVEFEFLGPNKPTAGTYVLGSLPFSSNQCSIDYSPTSSTDYGATAVGSVVVSVSGANTIITFHSAICPGTSPTTYTISGNVVF